MAIHEPTARLGQRQYHTAIVVPGFTTLGQCPGVVYLKGQASSKVQEGLDPGVCNNSYIVRGLGGSMGTFVPRGWPK